MKLAVILGDVETLSPRNLSREDFQSVLGKEFILFDAAWADLAPEGLYNSELILADTPRLAQTAGFAMQHAFLSDQVPLIVWPTYAGDAKDIARMSDFLTAVRLGSKSDTLDVVFMSLASGKATDKAREKLELLRGALSLQGVRIADIVVKEERFDADVRPYVTNKLIRDVAQHLQDILKSKGILVCLEVAQLKVARLLRKFKQEEMSIDESKTDAFAASIADVMLIDLMQKSGRK
ncbi:MAG: hypothetical protein ACJAX2_001816 [Celeribacter sp.]|jgi:hypothetical protein